MPYTFPMMHMNLTYVKQNFNNSILNGVHVMPAKDITSDGTGSFSMDRRSYSETAHTPSLTEIQTKRWYGGANRDASQIAANRRMHEIGMGSLNANGGDMSFMSNREKNTVNDALVRVRGAGYVVPPKVTHKKTNAPVAHWQPIRTMNPIKNMTPVSRSHRYIRYYQLPIGPRPPGLSRDKLSVGHM